MTLGIPASNVGDVDVCKITEIHIYYNFHISMTHQKRVVIFNLEYAFDILPRLLHSLKRTPIPEKPHWPKVIEK